MMKKCTAIQLLHNFRSTTLIKGREIVATSDENSQLSKIIIVGIGGFLLLTYFIGSIGYIMAGSGLKDVISTVSSKSYG